MKKMRSYQIQVVSALTGMAIGLACIVIGYGLVCFFKSMP